MKNIKKMTKEEFKKINNGTVFYRGFHVVINCKFIQTWEQLAEALGNAFQFPMRDEGFDGTWDWLTDLSWLGDQNEISLYFYESDELLKSNLILKIKIFDFFNDFVEYWKEEVKTAFIGGKPGKVKQIRIYLVN